MCLRPAPHRLIAAAAAFALALPAAGCSYTYQLDALFEKDGAKGNATAAATAGKAAAIPEADLALAKAAATELLARGAKDSSLPWENPRTGARGTVTPIASAYNQDGFVCQDFLASYVKDRQESWYQGGACRVHGGRWEVRDLRPLQRT